MPQAQESTELRARGHHVDAFAIAPDAHFLDGYVDTVPFASTTPQNGPAHLKRGR